MLKPSDNQYLDIHPDVRYALQNQGPVVALESTIICHGMPYPKNVETARRVESIIKDIGATPATIAILNGRLNVGLTQDQLEHLGHNGPAIDKVSRRDIPFIVARELDGATTAAATMIIAAMAGVAVMATGGIGGVHCGGQQSMDVSADLDALSRTNIAIVCAGIKSVLDIGRTLEYLETVGVAVVGYRTNTVPAFYARSSGFPVDYRVEDPAEIADMQERGIAGKESTPFLLRRIAERTGGRSLQANVELVLNNAELAARIAVEFSRLGATG